MGRLDRKRALKLRFRRTLHLQRRQVEELGAVAEQRLEDDFFKRLERLGGVWRFITSWVVLVVLLLAVVVVQARGLSSYYQTLQPASGGTYTEGVLGAFTNANPVYATNLPDTTVSHLLFSGLLTYDSKNQLAGDLADSWTVDARGTTYTVHLRPNLTWHDGQPLTSADVLFTYQVIQNPDAHSPLAASWQGITVAAPDAQTVTFTLPNVLASFPYSLTNGVIPKHLLGSVHMADMRSVAFNTTQPVGSGPFQWQAIELTGSTADKREEHIALKAYDNYYMGKPKLSSFVVRTFRSQEQLLGSFKHQELTAVAGLSQLPANYKQDGNVNIYNIPLTAAVMAFFDTSQGLTAEGAVRQALVSAADPAAVINNLDYPTQTVRQPLLHGQLAYNPTYNQLPYNPTVANELLDKAGWVRGKDGVRAKNGTKLQLNLYYHAGSEYGKVATQLADFWKVIGVNTKMNAQNDADFQGTISQAPSNVTHTYDVLLYGISIGVDPDVYVYWDSSQIDLRSPVRLNFSAYTSGKADAALESGRTRLDPLLRTVKYQPFLQAWQADAPALGLYQPRFLYLTHGTVYGLAETPINTDAQRFSNVYNWQIREVRK
ncbi:MAG TPA: peptide ABC transporter substrate-binding protein [Candidatus Saccharimonadales bacterium]|nr:peptide ABC transporter substrate-binding protein [Candidatus Saccharimonadales bacterium]